VVFWNTISGGTRLSEQERIETGSNCPLAIPARLSRMLS
jgi:hypothetical protein